MCAAENPSWDGMLRVPLERLAAGLLQKRIAWPELVVDAVATGDRRLALHALKLDEMAIRPEESERMLDALLAASRPMLGRFDL